MEINWVTVAAQIVNFLILVWLLSKFLYGPVTRAMSAREEKIRLSLEDAELAKQKAEDEAKRLQATQDDLEEKKELHLANARKEAETLRVTLEQDARNQIDEKRDHWIQILESEKAEFFTDLQHRASKEFFALSQAGLAALADEHLETAVIRKFIKKIALAPDADTHKLKDAARVEGFAGEIQSCFVIAPEDRTKIESAVNDIIGETMALEFTQNDGLIAGIRLRIAGQSIEWSIAKYLSLLRERVEGSIPVGELSKSQRAAE